MFFGWLWLLVVALVVVITVLAIRGRERDDDTGRRAAEDALARRYASGEIDEQEYRARSATLTEVRPRRAETSWVPLAIAVGAIVLLIAALVWGGMGSGWMWNTMGSHMGWTSATPTAGSAAQPIAGATEIAVTAGDLWFTPTTVGLNAGEPANLVLTNSGAILHDLSIPDLDLVLEAEPGETVTAGIQVDEPGTYEFLCSVPGHADAGMRGTLTVT